MHDLKELQEGTMKKTFFTIALVGLLFGIGYSAIQAAPTAQVETRSGCCSHHGGVAYCGKYGYYICNDGTQSPSCTCR